MEVAERINGIDLQTLDKQWLSGRQLPGFAIRKGQHEHGVDIIGLGYEGLLESPNSTLEVSENKKINKAEEHMGLTALGVQG